MFPSTGISVSPEKPCVVLLHGLLRTSRSMDWLMLDLRREGYRVMAPDYPTTRRTIREHAEWLRQLIEDIPCDSVYLVTHSLGSLISRDYLSRTRPEKVKKLVMITPPNHGSEMADQLRKFIFYRWVFGKVALQVTSDSLVGPEHLGLPHCPFGIIAGGKGNKGYSKKIPGDDDGILSVGKTYMKEADDFLILQASHNGILMQKELSENVISFLKDTRFLRHSTPPTTTRPE